MPLSEEALRALLAKSPVLIWSTDRELNLIASSDSRVADLFAAPASRAAHEAALQGRGGRYVVERNRRTFEAYVEPRSAGSRHVAGVAGVAVDVSERVVAERAMRISEHSFRSLVDQAPYGICRVTECGQFLQVNPAMLDMLGYDRDGQGDLLMRDLPLIFAAPEQFSACRDALLGEAALHDFESEWRRLDGRAIFVRLGGRAVRRASGSLLYFELFIEDITEKRELATRLEQAQKMHMIGQLAGGIAHDFNNLLTVINGYCDLTMLDLPDNGVLSNLKTIRQAGERASGLTQQLLAFSRQQVTVTHPVALNVVVKEVLDLSRRVIAENIRIVENADRGAGSVIADQAQLHQMLMNLVVNARDAMPSGGTLTVSTHQLALDSEQARCLDVLSGDYAVLTVSDTGTGMDEHVRSRVFEPFFTTKAVGKGTGLGLATVYALVRRLAGAVTVESSLGEGSTFRIYLPRSAAEPPPAAAAHVSPPIVRGSSTVLVVEDELSVRRFTMAVLRNAGYHLLEAANAEEALAVAGGHLGPIHLLLTDMVMPGLTGTELALHFRVIHPESKVLLVSGYSGELVNHDAIGDSIHYLQKPFTPDQLTRTVARVVS